MREHPSEAARRILEGKRVSADARTVAMAYLDLLRACVEASQNEEVGHHG